MNALILLVLICYTGLTYGRSASQMSEEDSLEAINIVGGQVANITKYPFVVYLEVELRVAGYVRACGGTILSATFVITAGHCLIDDPVNIKMSVGSADRRKGTVYNSSTFDIHPDYDDDTKDYDVGLITTDIKLDVAKAVRLPHAAARRVPVGAVIEIAGWGSTDEKSAALTILLRSTKIQVFNHSICLRIYGPQQVTQRMFCAGDVKKGGKDACIGDSGGPAVNGGGILLGIISAGVGCGDKSYPGLYIDVTAIRTWLHSVTKLL